MSECDIYESGSLATYMTVASTTLMFLTVIALFFLQGKSSGNKTVLMAFYVISILALITGLTALIVAALNMHEKHHESCDQDTEWNHQKANERDLAMSISNTIIVVLVMVMQLAF